jgi:outer membrane receptor protein involved in Fe transport
LNTLTSTILTLTFVLAVTVSATAQTLIKGTVEDPNGAAIAGAWVSFVTASGQTSSKTQTNSSGRFEIDVSAATTGTFIIEANGFSRAERSFAMLSSSSEISFVLSPIPMSAEISVTRSETRIEETPASVVALGSDELALTPAQSLDDKLRQVPGFSLFRRSGSRTANPTTQGVSLRGIGPSGASRALVLLDNVSLNDPFGGWVYWGRVPAESIAEVEVLRGSSSDLYGSSALGGVIAISTKHPDDTAGSLQLSAGSMSTPYASGFISSGVGNLRGSLGAELFRTDGFITIAEESRGPIDVEANVKYAALAPELEYTFGPHRRVFASGTYYREERGNGTPLQFNDTRIRNVVIGSDLYGISLRAYLTAQVYNQSFTSISSDRASETLLRLQRVPAQSAGLNAVWTKSFGSRFTLFSGTDMREIHGRSDENVFVNSRNTSVVSSGGREFTIGTFAGISVVVNSRVVLNGGVRIDHWRNFRGYTSTRSLITNSSSVNRFEDRSETAVSPRISLLVKARPNLSFSTTFSSGFRQPTLNELYRSFRVGDVLTVANENLRAERATNVEAGVIYSAFQRRLFVRGNFFCTRVSEPVANVTLTVTPLLITRQRQNLGSIRSCGIEADWEASLPSYLKLSGGYLFVDPKVVSFPANTSLEGLLIPQVARQQVTLQLQYSNPKVFTAALQMRAASSQFDDDQNQLKLASYTSFDAIIRKSINRNISVFVAIENLLDSKIEAGRTPVLTLASPRFFRAGVRLEFSKK